MKNIHSAIIATAVVTVICAAMASCTYTISSSNQAYYDTMKQCIDSGGSFIPTKGGDSASVCLHK